MEILERVQQITTDKMKGLVHLSYEKKLRDMGWFSLVKIKPNCYLINVYKIMKRGCKVGARLLSVVISTRTRGSAVDEGHNQS